MGFKEKLLQSLNKLEGVKLLKEDFKNYASFRLIGGALVTARDNIYGEHLSPKDYDIINANRIPTQTVVDLGYEFLYETENSKTFSKNNMIFQFIKSDVNTIDFTVSCISYSFNRDVLDGDLYTLEHKILIPTVQTDFHMKFNQLSRLTHYQAKGFTIHPNTFNNLIGSTYKSVGGTKLNLNRES